jgi:hypothetical protein
VISSIIGGICQAQAKAQLGPGRSTKPCDNRGGDVVTLTKKQFEGGPLQRRE